MLGMKYGMLMHALTQTKMVKLMRLAPSIHTPSAPLVQLADADTISLQGDMGSGLGEGLAAMHQEGDDATMAPSPSEGEAPARLRACKSHILLLLLHQCTF
jgi:hypothetical protein